jgi:hypothetical protein
MFGYSFNDIFGMIFEQILMFEASILVPTAEFTHKRYIMTGVFER